MHSYLIIHSPTSSSLSFYPILVPPTIDAREVVEVTEKNDTSCPQSRCEAVKYDMFGTAALQTERS